MQMDPGRTCVGHGSPLPVLFPEVCVLFVKSPQTNSVCHGMIDLLRMLQSLCRLLSLQQFCIVVQHLYHMRENLQCHIVVFHLAT